MAKYPCIKQNDEADCGSACLASVIQYYGCSFSLNTICEVCGTSQEGTNLQGLKYGSEQLGFNAFAAKVSPEIVDRINEVHLPMIIHWQSCHWVILYAQEGKQFVIGDPALGLYRVSKEELLENWHNLAALILEPDAERFSKQQHATSNGLAFFLAEQKNTKVS